MQTDSGKKAKSESQIKEFAHQSQFGGPAYIFDSRFLTERCLWIAIFGGFLMMTIYNVSQTVQTYIQDPVDTKVTAQRAPNITFPDATFCIVYKSSYFELELNFSNASHVRRLLKKITTNVSNIRNEIFVPAIQNLYEPMPNRTNELVMLTAILLSAMIAPESGKYFKDINELKNSSAGDAARAEHNATYESLSVVYDFWTNHNFGFEYLRQMVGRLMWRALDADLNCYTEFASSRLSDWNVSWLSFPPGSADTSEYLCSKVPANRQIVFTKGSDLCTIRLLPKLFLDNKEATPLFAVDFGGNGIHSPDPLDQYWEIVANQQRVVSIRVLGDFLSINTSTSTCMDYDNPSDWLKCRATCLARDIYERRACWPLSLSRLADGKPDDAQGCDERLEFENYTQPYPFDPLGTAQEIKNQTNHYMKLYDDICTDACLPSCRQLLMTVDQEVSSKQVNLSRQNESAQYMIRPSSFFYPMYEQQHSYDASKLFADLGGNIGLWLGGSIIGLVHVVIYLCRIAVAETCGNNIQKQEERFKHLLRRRVVQRMTLNRWAMNSQHRAAKDKGRDQQALSSVPGAVNQAANNVDVVNEENNKP